MTKIVKSNLKDVSLNLPNKRYSKDNNIIKAMTEAINKIDVNSNFDYDKFVEQFEQAQQRFEDFKNITIFNYDDFSDKIDDLKDYLQQGRNDSIFNRNSEDNNPGADKCKKNRDQLPDDWQTPFDNKVDNQREVYTYLSNMGLNDAAIAGIMGNIQQESRFNPASRGRDSNGYYSNGLFQWNERWTRAWVYGNTVESQMNYMQNNLSSSTLEKLQNVSDDAEGARQAALIFAREFEKCSSDSYGLRKKNAENYYESF